MPTPISALNIWPRASSCPAVWSKVATDLQAEFTGCPAAARQSIRSVFHDCINNACDGSLVLTDECSRAENSGLLNICKKIQGWSTKYSVGVADMLQFAAAQAISACPLGPKVPIFIGRQDSNVSAPIHSVPGSRDPLDSILAAFSAKGFNAKDVVALMGTHSVALQFFDDPSQAGKSLDSTPAVYDTVFYKETKQGTAPYTLLSDKRLSNSSQTEDVWNSFIDNGNAWATAFVDAWSRFAVIGNTPSQMADCSSLVPASKTSKKRQAHVAAFTKKMSAKWRL
ncbi:ligninase LG6 precursor [Pyrenophora seminiperda CCB06]|uniref:Peroxidase n=1 Tax=Pyrenophora seminiperda CCB06 TaxID=1302712 RepID=A0A3M7LW72_9PLEO|nr:ligninase LG6 precursor [Pyrenophora seminiperda CCB06]